MPRYTTYGKLDDKVMEDGDRGFIGFNNRLRPDQLQPSLLANSENARMGTSGQWQVRKGIQEVLAPLAASTNALTLSFTLDDSDPPTLNDNGVNQLYGACPFSDPNIGAENVSQYIVAAANAKAFLLHINDKTSCEIGYPGGAILGVDEPVNMIQAFNKVFLFRDGLTPLENRLRVSTISAAAVVGSTNVCTITTSAPHNLITGEIVTISNLGSSTTNPNGSTKTITVTGTTTFTYALSASGDETYTVTNNPRVATDFTKVASGTYTQPVPIDVTDCDISNGVATCTASSGDVAQLSVGNEITISVVDSSPFLLGETFTIATIPSTTTFTIITDQADVTNKAFLCTLPQSVAGGYTHMPSALFGHYHQKRLVLPFKYTVSGTDTYTYRNIQDEIIFSDILDSDTFDPFFNQFRFNAGMSDRVVAMHSFSEDVLIVFNRNSIHLVEGTSVVKNATTRLLTDEIGIIGKNTIEQVGNQILFLSDNGVYGIGFIEGYQLRGLEVPLSESIQKTIDRINKDNISKSQSCYFDNRYYLAVPLNDEDGTQRRECNAILIYNFLNKQWESIDTVNNQAFNIRNMFVAGEGLSRGVYVTNNLGGINKLEERVDGIDVYTVTIGGTNVFTQAKGALTTRQYTYNTLDRKKWRSFEMHVESAPSNKSNFDINGELENLDREISIGTLNEFNGNSDLSEGEDVSIRGRLGNPRAYGVQFKITNPLGRPIVRALKVDGIESFRSVDKAE